MLATRTHFAISGNFVARRSFLYNDRPFKPGDAFPWRDLQVPERRLRQLHDAGTIQSAEEFAKHNPVEEVETPKVAKKKA